jgi:hypothetical protein
VRALLPRDFPEVLGPQLFTARVGKNISTSLQRTQSGKTPRAKRRTSFYRREIGSVSTTRFMRKRREGQSVTFL